MWTIEYKGFYIHGYTDKPECRVLAGHGEVKPAFKSLHAAKCWCTRHLHLYHHLTPWYEDNACQICGEDGGTKCGAVNCAY